MYVIRLVKSIIKIDATQVYNYSKSIKTTHQNSEELASKLFFVRTNS